MEILPAPPHCALQSNYCFLCAVLIFDAKIKLKNIITTATSETRGYCLAKLVVPRQKTQQPNQ
jgi:hypothetical protein